MADIAAKLNKLKAAIYIRVSTQWQVDKDSLQVQRRELIAYCQMLLGIDDYEVFEDPGYSAKNTDRPDYQRMMERVRSGEFSHVVVWKLDRISRNLLDFAAMYAELKSLGVTFVSKNEQFDTSSAMGEAMLKIILVFAELERQITAERVTATMLSKASVGEWNGGRIPYGYIYTKETKEFSLHPEENKVFNSMVDMYEERQSLTYVTRWLNDAGIRTRNGNLWSIPSVYKILTNIWNAGAYRYNVHKEGTGYKVRPEDEWITIYDHHVPAIDMDRYERLLAMLTRNKRGGVKPGVAYQKKNIHLFAGLVQCGSCGSNMSATLDKRRADGWRPSIYGCALRRKQEKTCVNKYTSDVYLGPFVFNFLANIIRANGNVAATTSLETLESKLLRGDVFYGMSIETESLAQLYDMLIGGRTGMEYAPASVFRAKAEDDHSEREFLESRRRKDEAALNRLKSLYLFGDDTMSETDYIVERKKLLDDLEDANAKLADLKQSEQDQMLSDEDFLRQASYFIMVEKMLDDRYVDFEKYIRNIEPSVPRSFVQTVLNRIAVLDGRVTEIELRNGISVKFSYK